MIAQGQVDETGDVFIALPAGTDAENLPAISCFISGDQETWLIVDYVPVADEDPYCGLVGIGTDTPGLALINVTPGWFYYLVAVY